MIVPDSFTKYEQTPQPYQAAVAVEYVSDRGRLDQQEGYLSADGPAEPYHRCLGDWSAAHAEQWRCLEFPLSLTAFKCPAHHRECLCQLQNSVL